MTKTTQPNVSTQTLTTKNFPLKEAKVDSALFFFEQVTVMSGSFGCGYQTAHVSLNFPFNSSLKVKRFENLAKNGIDPKEFLVRKMAAWNTFRKSRFSFRADDYGKSCKRYCKHSITEEILGSRRDRACQASLLGKFGSSSCELCAKREGEKRGTADKAVCGINKDRRFGGRQIPPDTHNHLIAVSVTL